MRLKSFGCSFIFGSELNDAVYVPGNVNSSKNTWPAHLARHLNATYTCFANPGAGNLQILEQVLNQAPNSNSLDLFVVNWTWIDRFDYYSAVPNQNPWQTIMPVDADNIAKVYYRDLHSEYRDKFTSLGYIKLAIDILDQKGIPFIMTYMDNLLFDQRWHTTPAVLDLQGYIKPRTTTFEGQTFLDWSRLNGYPETATWHPLESAHQAAGDYVIKIFDQTISSEIN
jgi:hypothetical protein